MLAVPACLVSVQPSQEQCCWLASGPAERGEPHAPAALVLEAAYLLHHGHSVLYLCGHHRPAVCRCASNCCCYWNLPSGAESHICSCLSSVLCAHALRCAVLLSASSMRTVALHDLQCTHNCASRPSSSSLSTVSTHTQVGAKRVTETLLESRRCKPDSLATSMLHVKSADHHFLTAPCMLYKCGMLLPDHWRMQWSTSVDRGVCCGLYGLAAAPRRSCGSPT